MGEHEIEMLAERVAEKTAEKFAKKYHCSFDEQTRKSVHILHDAIANTKSTQADLELGLSFSKSVNDSFRGFVRRLGVFFVLLIGVIALVSTGFLHDVWKWLQMVFSAIKGN